MSEIAVRGRPFPSGVSGNPNGRPPGHHTRHLFSEAFMRDLSASWTKDGPTVLQRVAKENPSSYFAVCARLLPSDVSISIQAQTPALDASDLAILRAIKQAVVDADQREPAEVLQFTLDAIRAHGAKLVETCTDVATVLPEPASKPTDGEEDQ
jgi:hypothetical protein